MNRIMLYSYLLLVFLFFWPIMTIAQVNADIIRPSVNAGQFSNAVKAETALSKGQLSLNIPLMELKGKGYDLPISLLFYNGDVIFSTEASPVGLGWSLIAGGIITQTIKGSDDFNTRYLNKEHHYDGNYILNNWENNSTFIFDIQEDPMPDEFIYSIPGHSGTIDMSIDCDTIRGTLYPDESYNFECTEDGFCITDDNGNIFYFEDVERRTYNIHSVSTSWFLTRIATTKGGVISFYYAEEEYFDISTEDDELCCPVTYRTKRITSITSDFGTITFDAEARSDRACPSTAQGLESMRINRIEMRDENGNFVKGYELDNSGLFENLFADPYSWYDRRHKLSSVTQYDSVGNHLPPYEFTYSYKFSKPRLSEGVYLNGECLPRDSWTSNVGPQAYVNLNGCGDPLCRMIFPNTPYTYLEGITIQSENTGPTDSDYFCLDSIRYPTGAFDEFIYENHSYKKVNHTGVLPSQGNYINGKRLKRKISHGSELNQQTDYVYILHDSSYNANGGSSGVMTNPSFHCATYYTPEPDGNTWKYNASRVVSGNAFNSFMGPPVCYTEVEEVEKDEFDNTLNRTIHYFAPQIVSPPVNYICVESSGYTAPASSLIEVGNRIYGTKTGYMYNMAYLNNEPLTYMTYPVGEFYDTSFWTDQPMKEVFIGKNDDVKSIREYNYSRSQSDTKYGYKVVSVDHYNSGNPPTKDCTTHLLSVSEYIPHRFRLHGISTTHYYYNENSRDSICEEYRLTYNKGRICYTSYSRNNEDNKTYYYFPGDIMNIVGNSASSTIEAVSGLVEKNIVADPIKTVLERNGKIIGGECKDYQMLSGEPLLKSIYKLKNTVNNHLGAPVISGNDIDYRVEWYKEGEIMTYDEYRNPEHIKLNESQDRIYVWGYGGRFPVAVIDNMDYTSFQAATNLRTGLLQLATYRKIETGQDCANLRNLNAAIRALLPDTAHITTYTYDPYFGMTSEIDDSNLGTIYTYDTFGRLSAKYDVNYKKKEEYNYNLKFQ